MLSIPVPFLANQSAVILQRGDNRLHGILRVTEQHVGVVIEEQRILHTGVASVAHRALEDDDLLGIPHAHDGHAGDGTVGLGLGGRG